MMKTQKWQMICEATGGGRRYGKGNVIRMSDGTIRADSDVIRCDFKNRLHAFYIGNVNVAMFQYYVKNTVSINISV